MFLLSCFFVVAASDDFTRTNYFDSSSSKTRFLYGSTHPTVSQSSIAGILMQDGDLFVGDGIVGKGETTRIIKAPTQPFRINGLHYYWDPVFVPPDCKSARKSEASLLSNGVVESFAHESPTTSSPRPSTVEPSTSHPRNTLVNLLSPEKPIVFISSRTTTQEKTNTSMATTSPSKTSNSTPTTTSSSTSTSKSTTMSTIPSTTPSTTKTSSSATRTSQSDVDLVLEFLQSLHSGGSDNISNYTLGDEIEVPRARRQAVGYRFSSTPSTTLPSPIRPHVEITEVDPCFNVGESSPKVCTRLLDRRDDRDPLMHIAFPNGTKVAELAWRCPVGLYCCEWECCEMSPVKRRRHSVVPYLIAAAFIIIGVIVCIFCFRSYKEGEERRRNLNQLGGPNDYQMRVTNPPQAVERDDFDDGPRNPPPVPRAHFHVHEETRFVPPPIPSADRVNGTYRKHSRVAISNPNFLVD